jgi:hypothetical protein
MTKGSNTHTLCCAAARQHSMKTKGLAGGDEAEIEKRHELGEAEVRREEARKQATGSGGAGEMAQQVNSRQKWRRGMKSSAAVKSTNG